VRASILSVAATTLVAAVLICLYVVAARPLQAPPIPRLSPPVVLSAWTVLALALMGAVGAALAHWLRHRRRRRAKVAHKGFPMWFLAAISVGGMVLTLVVAAVILSLMKPPPIESAQDAPQTSQVPIPRVEGPEEIVRTPRVLDKNTVALILIVMAVAGTAVLIGILIARRVKEERGRLAMDDEELAGLRRELAAGFRVSLEEILAEADYRQAVIACYQRMEQSFASAGYPRAAPEAPLEYLERVVRDARVADSARGDARLRQALVALTGLYEIARFSEHAVLPEDRADAVSSLRILEGALSR